jgi:hypothetical protein
MAKSKSFFGLRTGSTKSLTFQVYRGQQITKDRVYRVSNPRTEAQMTQRALIPIVAAARSALKGLVDHSFEGVQYGEASLKEFSALNLRAGALNVSSYSPVGYSNPGFADFIVSKGSINEQFEVSDGGNVMEITLPGTYPKIKFSADGSVDQVWRDLETWARSNNVSLLKPGTQLTFLSLYENGSVNVSTGGKTREVSTSAFNICRIYIPNGDSDSVNAKDVNGKWKIDESVGTSSDSVNLINDHGDKLSIMTHVNPTSETEGEVEITVTPADVDEDHGYIGMALILSRKEAGIWKRNTARVHIDNDPQNVFTFADWQSAYQTSRAASTKYLNTGDEGTGI